MKPNLIKLLVGYSLVFLAFDQARAAGAVAEGIAPGGYVVNLSFNSKTEEEARKAALEGCKKGEPTFASGRPADGSDIGARARCAVVITFSNKCASSALDPEDGTPGAGWATGNTQKEADDEAMARCRSTAGDRRNFCKVMDQGCDGTAK